MGLIFNAMRMHLFDPFLTFLSGQAADGCLHLPTTSGLEGILKARGFYSPRHLNNKKNYIYITKLHPASLVQATLWQETKENQSLPHLYCN